jgi:hypothetical protein
LSGLLSNLENELFPKLIYIVHGTYSSSHPIFILYHKTWAKSNFGFGREVEKLISWIRKFISWIFDSRARSL